MLLAFHPMLLSGLDRMQADPGDSRFNNYILEHGYLWLKGVPLHREFWNPPIFYPQPNTAGYSDILLGVAPFYWMWRAAGFPADTAFQLWMLTVSSLNYLATYLLLRKCLRCTPFGAALGAFLFAFASSRVAQIGHQQLLPQFFTIVAVYALFQAFELHAAGRSRLAGSLWVLLFFAAFTAQLYSGYYQGWFLAVGIGIAAGWALVLPDYRTTFLALVRTHLVVLGIGLAASALVLAPMAIHYVEASATVGRRHFLDAYNTMPGWSSWLNMGSDSWLYGWAAGASGLSMVQFEHEQRLGIGLLTSVAVFVGLFRARERPFVRILFLSALAVAFCTSFLSHEIHWCRWYFHHFPGAYGVRVVARVGLLMLLPASVGLALFVQRLQGTRPAWVVLGIAALVVLEQGRALPSYDKAEARAYIQSLARRIPPGCEIFFMTPERGSTGKYNLDAMWVQLRTGVPTVNGYSGNQPPGWPFVNMSMVTEEEERTVKVALTRWLRSHRVDSRRVSWVRVPESAAPW